MTDNTNPVPQQSQPIETPPQVQTQDVAQAVTTPATETIQKPKASFIDLMKDTFGKFKSNKVLFRIGVSFLVIIVLIIVLGTIYSLVNSRKNGAVSVSPTPEPTPEIVLTEESKNNESKLNDLKTKIMNLDIDQKHLTPPTIEFKISF